MIVVGGSASTGLAKDLARELNAEYVQALTKTFPDGETYARIDRDALHGEVVIVQNSYPNDKLVELLLLQDAALGLGAEKVTCVIPYFGYARQDERFNRGEPLSAKVMVEHIQMSADRVVLVDIHNPEIMDWFTKAKVKDVHAAPCIGDFFKEHGVDLVLAPDEGALKRAGWTAERLGVDWDYMIKTRLSGTHVHMTPKNIDAKDRRVLIVDDIISTGGTIIAATEELKRLGARNVMAACTHGLFVGNALDNLKKHVDRLACANTLESEVSLISVAPVVARAIQE
ncbi:MAG: ribose-phosphate diphosphokinase [Euryarchaeota archaeon]|jgi:ribose-phosphate pyrophosphokinase|nr:ribose-phosphate diphosphokinase [Euryarchaeota archaeon]